MWIDLLFGVSASKLFANLANNPALVIRGKISGGIKAILTSSSELVFETKEVTFLNFYSFECQDFKLITLIWKKIGYFSPSKLQ